jgi:hypothetical protein
MKMMFASPLSASTTRTVEFGEAESIKRAAERAEARSEWWRPKR